MDTEQENKQLEIACLHLALSKCCAAELARAKVDEVEVSHVDADGNNCRVSVKIKTDDIAQQEIRDVLIRYKQRVQNRLKHLEDENNPSI